MLVTDSPTVLIYALAYGLSATLFMWLGKVLWQWWEGRTESRKVYTDRLSKSERRVRKLTESLHEHRSVMLQSGQWTRETLPPFIEIIEDDKEP